MIDDSCKVPREDLDEGFNPCRRQVVENGELGQYAHMYDVMNERYDREEDTSYLNSVKRDRITHSTPSQTVGEGKLYAQNAQGVEGFIKSSETLDPTTHAEIPSSKAVADYVPIPLPISKGGTGGNTPHVTDDLDSSAIFVMHDAPNDRYDAAPMSALTGYLDNRYNTLIPSYRLTGGSDLNNIKDGTYFTGSRTESNNLVNKPNYDFLSSVRVYQFANGSVTDTRAQIISENQTGTTFYRYRNNNVWSDWSLLYPTRVSTIPNPLPVNMGGTGAQTSAAALTSLGVPQEISNAFAARTATTVADNDLLPTNALMIDYVDAHSMGTPPDKFSFAVSPVPTGTWDGEMTINVVPVFATTIGSVTYVVARVYGSKRFNYTGSADDVNLFLGLKPVEEYTGALNSSTNIPLTLSVSGRSYTQGTYGFTPNGSTANLSLNNQTVTSVFNLGDFNISNNLKCVFGEGTNTPAVTVTVNCVALMWNSPM